MVRVVKKDEKNCDHEQMPRVLNSSNKTLYQKLMPKAVEMRKDKTTAEAVLWECLRNRNLNYKFRQQHVIHKFVVDFYCIEKALVIEVDGDIHKQQRLKDEERDSILSSLGCTILRFQNDEVLRNIEGVLQKITATLQQI